jgi:hypothetical protein
MSAVSKKGGARIERGIDDLARPVQVDSAAEVVAPQADLGDEQIRIAQPLGVHGGIVERTWCPLRVQRVRPQWLILGGGILVTAAIRGWLASRVSTPWLFSDELIHSELAKNLANGSLFEIRSRHVNVTYAYPLVLAPAWLLPSMASTYAAAKAINIVLLSGAAIPVYLWGRRLVSPVGAAVAAVLVLLLPELALSSALMQENLAFPAFLVAVLALGLVLEAPTPGRQVFLIAATALAAAARFELLVLVPIIPTAIVFARASARRLAGVLVPTVGVILAMIALAAARPSRLQDALQTFPETSAGYRVGGVLEWLVRRLAELDLSTGVIPLVALVALTAARGTPRRPGERAFLAVTWSCLLWFLVLGGLSGSWEPFGLKERYVFYVQPLLVLALLLWLERGAGRRLLVALAAADVLALAVAFLPLRSLLTAPSLPGNALGMELFRRLGNLIGFGGELRALLIAGAVALPLIAVVTTRGRVLAVAFVAAFLAVSSAFADRIADDQARVVAQTALLPPDRSWVDSVVGKDADVVLLNTANFMPETLRRDFFSIWVPWWETQFWNRSAREVDSLGSPEPLPLAQRSGTLDWATGVVAGVPPAARILVDPRFELAGRQRGATKAFVLYDRVASPLRLVSATEGVFRDGESTGYAAYDRWRAGSRQVRIEIARPADAGKVGVSIRIGTLTANGPTPVMGRVTATGEFTAVRSVAITVRVPKAPFRIEVRFGPGVHGVIRFSPAR